MPADRIPRSSPRATRLKWTATIVCIVLAIIGALLGLRSPMLHQYEYQEDLYLALNGSATLYVTSSLPALVALYGLDLPTDPVTALDRGHLRQAFSGPGVEVSTITSWRRLGRRFVSVRIDTANVRWLSGVRPFATTTFDFGRASSGYRLAEQLGPALNRAVGDVGWRGDELVGFRWHIPAKVERYNTENLLRGNILVWEQPLASRLRGRPIRMAVLMQGQSILSSALWLFAVSAAFALAAVTLVVWWVVRRPAKKIETMASREHDAKTASGKSQVNSAGGAR